MLGTAGNLALLPNYRIFVIVSIALYILVFVLTEKFVRSAFRRKLIEVATAASFIIFCMVWSAHNAGNQLLIDKGMDFQPITGAVDIRLLDIRSLEGWAEGESGVGEGREHLVHGDHRANQGQPDAVRIFDHILDQAGVRHRTGEGLVRMSQLDWVAFLRELTSEQRVKIGTIPFAVVEVRSDDDKIERVVMFKHERRTVRNRDGTIAGRFCLDRIFNVRDDSSGEREAIVVSHGRSSCR